MLLHQFQLSRLEKGRGIHRQTETNRADWFQKDTGWRTVYVRVHSLHHSFNVHIWAFLFTVSVHPFSWTGTRAFLDLCSFLFQSSAFDQRGSKRLNSLFPFYSPISADRQYGHTDTYKIHKHEKIQIGGNMWRKQTHKQNNNNNKKTQKWGLKEWHYVSWTILLCFGHYE